MPGLSRPKDEADGAEAGGDVLPDDRWGRRPVYGLWPIVARTLGTIGLLAVLLLAWQAGEDLLNRRRVDAGLTTLEIIVPSPRTILLAYRTEWSIMQQAMLATLRKAAVGFTLGASFGVVVALLYTLVPGLRQLTLPLGYAFSSFPVYGLAPAIVLAFGQDTLLSIAVIAAILSYLPVLLTLDAGFSSVSPELLELAELYNSRRWQKLRYIQAPLAAPSLFIGLRLAVPASIVGATVGELLGSRDGVGSLVAVALYQLDSGLLYGLLIETAVLCALLAVAIEAAERVVLPWKNIP